MGLGPTLTLALALALTACSSDETCGTCRDEKCADLLELCNADDDCACMGECLGDRGVGGVDACLEDCGLSERPAGYGAVEACVAVACPDSDECSTPADFVAMDDHSAGGDGDASCDVAVVDVSAQNAGMTVACDASASGCTGCQAEKCCELLEACSTNGDCACMALCVGAGGYGETDACLTDCGLTGSPPGFVPLAECVAPACPDSDECVVPGGYAPPAPIHAAAASASDSIGSGDMADCGFDPALTFDPTGEVLQLQSEDGQICVRVERRNDGSGSLANTMFTLLRLTVGPPGQVARIEDAVCYYSSHHNFNDWAHGSTATRHYDLSLTLDDHGGTHAWTLHAFSSGTTDPDKCQPLADGVCRVGEPITLVAVNP